MGHPLKKGNEEYIMALKRKLPTQYEKVERPTFESLTDIVLIKITPNRISMPSQKDTFTMNLLDVDSKKAFRLTGKDWVKGPSYKE